MGEKVSSFEGFLHRSDEGKWLLCDSPNLKSCCLTKHAIVSLEGDFSRYQTNTAVKVEGILHSNHLSQVRVHEKNGAFPYWTFGSVLLLVCLWGLLKVWKKRPLLP